MSYGVYRRRPARPAARRWVGSLAPASLPLRRLAARPQERAQTLPRLRRRWVGTVVAAVPAASLATSRRAPLRRQQVRRVLLSRRWIATGAAVAGPANVGYFTSRPTGQTGSSAVEAPYGVTPTGQTVSAPLEAQYAAAPAGRAGSAPAEGAYGSAPHGQTGSGPDERDFDAPGPGGVTE